MKIDKTFVINLDSEPARMARMEKRLAFVDIEWERYRAIPGSTVKLLWEKLGNPHFANPNYLACAITHLSVYRTALDRGYKRILVLEDDVRVHRDFWKLLEETEHYLDQQKLVYFGYIPLSDDCSMWDYSFTDKNRTISGKFFEARNLWGLFAYSLTDEAMRDLLKVYEEFPMEIDRYLVTHYQKQNKCYGLSPQLFCHEDGPSSNSGRNETGMIERSVDARYAKHHDYV